MQADWLLAVGCSLTWGSEITQQGESLPEDKDQAWPAALGKHLNVSHIINRGFPGRSNNSIFRVAMQEIVKCYQEFGILGVVAIQWTGLYRMEIVNPFIFDVKEYYKASGQQNHPGQESTYLCISPGDIDNIKIQQQFPGIYHYFLNHWAHDFYQIELLLNYSIALTSLATKLGIKIIQFNGVEALDFDKLPSHAAHMPSLLGKEYINPTNKNLTFWSVAQGPMDIRIPAHPNADQHAEWADILYKHLST